MTAGTIPCIQAEPLALIKQAGLIQSVADALHTMGAGWCPPGMLGIGIGGSAGKAMLMAKDSIDIQELIARGVASRAGELRIELHEKVNALGDRRSGPGRPHRRARRQGQGPLPLPPGED